MEGVFDSEGGEHAEPDDAFDERGGADGESEEAFVSCGRVCT